MTNMTLSQQRKWGWLCILLVFLLLVQQQQIYAHNDSTEDPYKQYTGTDEPYEVIDVAQQQQQQHGNDANIQNNLQTGQTTRIFTAGDIGEDFWLKHLGEDFKLAVHLQVGGNEFNEIYNMTEDGSTYKVQHEYGSVGNPVDGNEKESKKDINNNNNVEENFPTEKTPGKTEKVLIMRNNKSNNTSSENRQERETVMEKSVSTKNMTSFTKTEEEKYEEPYERIFSLDDTGMKLYRASNHHKYTKFAPYASLRYSSSSPTTKHTQQHKDTRNTNTNTNTSNNSKQYNNKHSIHAPIIINLPQTQKTIHQLDENEMPVVVKMPPVIYHRKPIYRSEDVMSGDHSGQQEAEDDQNKKGTTNTNTHTNTQTDTQTHTKTHTHTLNLQEQHQENQHTTQQQHHQQQQQKQSTSLDTQQHHEQFHRQQQRQKLQYPFYVNTPNLYNPSHERTYHNNGHSQNFYRNSEHRVTNEAPYSSLSRISRSNQEELFEQGL